MNKCKKFFSCIALATALTTSCTAKLEYTEDYKTYGSNATYDVFKNGHITTGIWVTPPDKYRNEDAFRIMSESGINMINGFMYYENTEDEINNVLTYCDKYNINYLINSELITNNIQKYANSKDQKYVTESMDFIDKFSSHKSFAGVLFMDEPNGALFDSLKVFFDAFKERFPNKIANVNLFPDYATSGATGYSRYEDYINYYLDKTNSPVLSYDSYPLFDTDTTNENYIFEDDGYFRCLDLLRQTSLDRGVPLWSFISTLGFTHQTEFTRRTPNRDDIRWTVFSNLAFGVKGLQYFCYYTPDQDSFQPAMIDRANNPTDRYTYVKEVNEEIRNYEDVLMNADCVGMMLNDYRRNGQSLFYTGLKKFGPIRGIDGNKYVAGCFQDKDTGKKSMLITATNPRDDIELTLNTYDNIKSAKAYINGQLETINAKNNQFKLNIKAGDCILICFEQER